MVLSRQPSLQECLTFAKKDTVNPLTGRTIQRNKAVWKELTEACHDHLAKNDFDILSRPAGQSQIHLNDRTYESFAIAYLTMKHANDCGLLYSVDRISVFDLYNVSSSRDCSNSAYVLLYPSKLDK